MIQPDAFKPAIPEELIQPVLPGSEVLPAMDPAMTAAGKINTISNSILQTGVEIAPGILAIAGMIYVFRKVYQNTVGNIL